MKKIVKGKLKKTILAILICIMCMTVFPIPANAKGVGSKIGGALFLPISQFLCKVGDVVIGTLQKIFIGEEEGIENGEYYTADNMNSDDTQIFIDAVRNTKNLFELDNNIYKELPGGDTFKWDTSGASTYFITLGKIKLEDHVEYYKEGAVDEKWINIINPKEGTSIITDEDLKTYLATLNYNSTGEDMEKKIAYSIKFSPAVVVSGWIPGFDVNFIAGTSNPDSIYSDMDSTATKLQGVVSKAFQGLQLFAIVGLLSVLVYMAIRIITGSVGQKSKYKQMLMDWLAAMCILFTLLFIMIFILNITQSITRILSVSTISENGEDILMTDLRNKIGEDLSFESVFAETVIYLALVFYTCSFTIKYLKRVVYMAFLTMIAPLIALTYPLDKIKDSKAQAFSMWLKEYIFNAMIQPVDLLLYYILLGSSVALLNNPIYALVAIGFLTPAEKFFRKMFGMESRTPVGQLGAAAAGATTMNLINKMKSAGKGGAKGGSAGEKAPQGVRTATIPVLAGLQSSSANTIQSAETEESADDIDWQKENADEDIGEGANLGSGFAHQTENEGASVAYSQSQGTHSTNQNVSSPATGEREQKTQRDFLGPIGSIGQEQEVKKSQEPRPIAGVANLRKVGIKKVVKSGARLAGKTAGTLAIGTIGVAAGVTSGDLNTVFQNAVAGGAIGGAAGTRLVNGVMEETKNLEKAGYRTLDTYREGAYDRETAENMKFDREFFNSTEGKELIKEYAKEEVQKCLEAGVTEKKKIEKILKVSRKISKAKPSERNPVGKAIAYSHLAEKCKDDILINDSKFIRYLEVNKIPTDNATEIRAGIAEFKK